jgi:hypothetical protein
MGVIVSLLILGTSAAIAGTFNPTPYLADAGIDVLSRNIANEQFDRDLFGDPYATVVIGNVDVYDRFPYIEARYFQIVSDPTWNRLLLGEVGRSPSAFDGRNSPFGALASPRGLSADGNGRVYVADSVNDRVLVFQSTSEFDRMTLEPVFVIDNLNDPYDLAYSDGGTPFDARDDVLLVANTGRNEVRRYALNDDGAQLTHTIGELGSGDGRLAGPMAITVGHHEGAHSADIYISDAHNGRIVHLRDTGSTLQWIGSSAHGLGVITSLDTDHWGNVYAAAPQTGGIEKYTNTLLPVANLAGDIQRPRSFHIPFANVTDHRTGGKTRAGQGLGVLVEQWGDNNGIRLLNLGVELSDAAVAEEDGAAVQMTLTDHAAVTAEIMDTDGRVIAHHNAGVLGAGPQMIRFADADYVGNWEPGDYRMTVRAASTYDKSHVREVEMSITMDTAGGPALPDRLALLGNTPNPFNPTTTIRFMVPAGPARPYSVRVYDVEGRLVRTLGSGNIGSGHQELAWDGRNDRGTTVSSGVYMVRVEVGQDTLTGKMVMLK